MKGDSRIIELLNEVLTAELTAVNQYFIHARLQKHWGYQRLGDYTFHESVDEMKHAQQVIDRILYLEGIPNLQRYGKVMVGETVPEQFKLDLEVEYAAVKRLNDGIVLCRDLKDDGTRDLLTKILVGEEEHVDWLETQLELVKALGDAHYLAQHIHEKS
jgi:bacterioferritin